MMAIRGTCGRNRGQLTALLLGISESEGYSRAGRGSWNTGSHLVQDRSSPSTLDLNLETTELLPLRVLILDDVLDVDLLLGLVAESFEVVEILGLEERGVFLEPSALLFSQGELPKVCALKKLSRRPVRLQQGTEDRDSRLTA